MSSRPLTRLAYGSGKVCDSTVARSTSCSPPRATFGSQALLPQDAEERALARVRPDRHRRGQPLPAGHHDEAFIMPPFFKPLETLQVAFPARCDTGSLS